MAYVVSRELRVFARAALLVALFSGCRADPGAASAQLDESRRLAADLRVQFAKASEAADRAVMADTDDASTTYAKDAETAAGVVQRDVASLEPLLSGLKLEKEPQLLTDFEKHWGDYGKFAGDLLKLAVENTNLKAQALAFGPIRKSADDFQGALAAVAESAPAKDHCHVEELVAEATLAVRDIQVLQGPHIAESGDGAMTEMEQKMTAAEAKAQDAVKALQTMTPDKPPAQLATAVAAFDAFKKSSDELVRLSRLNSNVKSLDMALHDKPPLAAACDESLRQLQEALTAEGSKATR
jgi:hypothetical protein